MRRAIAAVTVVALGGCQLLLGLDEYGDEAPGSGGAGGAAVGTGGASPPPSEIVWSYTLGGPLDDGATELVSAGRNLYLAATAVSNTIRSDCPGTFSVNGPTNLLIAQLTDQGGCNWIRGVTMGMSTAPAIDADENALYVAGGFTGTITFPLIPQLATGSESAFIAKYRPDGSVATAKALPGSTLATSVRIRPNGGLFLAGAYAGTVTIFTSQLMSPDRYHDVLVAWLTEDLVGEAAYGYVGNDEAQPLAVTLAGDGSTRIVGFFQGSFESLVSAGAGDMFVANVETGTGNILWVRGYGSANYDGFPWDVALTPGLQTVVVGELHSPVDFGAGNLVPDAIDAFAIQLGQDGSYQQSIWWGEGGDDRANAVAVDDEGSIIIGGSFEDTIAFSQDMACTAAIGRDGFVVKLDHEWVPIWVRCLGGSGDQDVTDVAIDDLGRVVVAGAFTETIELDVTHTSNGGKDLFVAVLAP
jgi:hypothetical protein